MGKSAALNDSEAKGKSRLTGRESSDTPHGLCGTFFRNNLRRPITLPSCLLAWKSGQTVSENHNGSLMKNIFLTLVQPKSTNVGSNAGSSDKNQNILPNGFSLLPAAVGLKNLGNTCFINVIVQCLSHTDWLAKYLVTDGYKTDLRRKHGNITNGKFEVTEELATLLKNAWLIQNPAVLEDAVTRFRAAIEKRTSQWRGSEQQDAQEFFMWLLDQLHEDLNQASSVKYEPMNNNLGRSDEQVAAEVLASHLRCNESIIEDIFGAHFRSSLTCGGCGRGATNFEPFLCVSLPIPQQEQKVPVYVNIVYLAQQPRQVQLSVESNADIKELKQLLTADTGIKEHNMLLSEIDREGFHRTFTETQLVSSLSNNVALYCIETPQIRETNANGGAFLMIMWANILVTDNGNTRVRFRSPYVTQVARETGFVEIQKVFLKEMAAILQNDVLISKQKDPVFSIKILDGSAEGSLVDSLLELPLYMEAVDHALSLCDGDVPSHIKVHLEWTPESKDKLIINDAETVEEHAKSVSQTRLKDAKETTGSVTLGECFDLYTAAEQLSAEDSWHCSHCNRKEQGTLKMIGFWTAPKVLVVQLKRFRQVANARTAATKISSVVDFPIEGLDLGPYVMRRNRAVENIVVNSGINQASSSGNGWFGIGNWMHRASLKKQPADTKDVRPDEITYDLYAVCNHHGRDVLGGHYTSYCKNPVDGSWWSFNDLHVSKLSSPADVKTASAYILFYRQRDSLNNQQTTQNWCRSLLKKQNLAIAEGVVKGIEVPISAPEDKENSDTDKEGTSYHNEASSSGTLEKNSVSTSTKDTFTTPFAIVEEKEVSMELSRCIEKVQIENTVLEIELKN